MALKVIQCNVWAGWKVLQSNTQSEDIWQQMKVEAKIRRCILQWAADSAQCSAELRTGYIESPSARFSRHTSPPPELFPS